MTPLQRACESLDGLSIGDAFGQSFFQLDESLEAELINERRPPAAPWRYTDDTEMSLSVVAALAEHGAIEPAWLAQSFSARYSFDRGYGPAMHRILGRIRDNGDWRTAAGEAFGGQGSFGNGAAMRAAPIGAFFADDLERVVAQAAISAKTTHAHPEGVAGAVAVAVAAAWAVRFRVAGNKVAHSEFLRQIAASTPSSEVRDRLLIAQSLDDVRSLQFPAAALGNGTQMSAPDTVPYALWCSAQSLSDFESAMWLAIGAGGDRDTLAAIVGGVVASFVGSNAIPPAWRESREPLPEWHVSQ